MAILLSAHQLSKSFSTQKLFSGLTFSVESGERIGLIGPNGAGKSTLLRIVASQASPDSGTLSLQRGLRVGFLEQVPMLSAAATILDNVLEGFGSMRDEHDWEQSAAAHEWISKLGLDHYPDGTLAGTLSGGWRKRVALARELVKKPDLLLLDEPTNHLDVESIVWLEGFLARAPFATITITHDRLFLQRVANRILELDARHEGGILSVKGDYAAYLEVRENLIFAQERREIVLKNTLRRETEWLRRGAKARTTKQQARIERHGDLSAEVDDLSRRNQARSARIEFHASDKSPKRLLEAKGLAKNYGDRTLFSGLDLLLGPGTRIGLLGANGSGKSTLIRALIGAEAPTTGEVTRSEHLSIAYFDQNRETLAPSVTVAKTLCPTGDHVDYRGGRVHIRSYLDRFLFTQGQMDMAVGKLSGGEQSRLLIARLMLTQANLLILDEPTNDLDMATLTVLEECLRDFPGAVILVTHDRYFLDQVATKILAFPGPVSFASLEQWEDWAAKGAGRANSAQAAQPQKPAGPAPRRKLSYKDQRELDSMEATIHAAEAKLGTLTRESEQPELATDAVALGKVTAEMARLTQEIERLYARWAELEGQ